MLVGAEGVLVVGLLTSLTAAVVIGYCRLVRWAEGRRNTDSAPEGSPSRTAGAIVSVSRSLDPWAIAIVLLLVVGGSFLVDWRLFGAVLALAAAMTAAWLHNDDTFPLRTPGLIGVLAAASAILAITWGVEGAVGVQSVKITPFPLSRALSKGEAPPSLPYFGESSGFVYVGMVASPKTDPQCAHLFCTGSVILALDRSKTTLAFTHDARLGPPHLRSPASEVWWLIRGLIG